MGASPGRGPPAAAFSGMQPGVGQKEKPHWPLRGSMRAECSRGPASACAGVAQGI